MSARNSGDVALNQSTSVEKAKLWCNNPAIDLGLRKEVEELLKSNNLPEIEERFYRELEFGTGGMRSIRGAGTNRINSVTIGLAAQALSEIILEDSTKGPNKIAISYDSRIWSAELAKFVATVFAGNGITALLYRTPNPVALLSYAIRSTGSNAGVMVTASHNPPEYNGFKVFWADGAQVTPPYDNLVINRYNSLGDPSKINTLDFEKALERDLIQWLGEEMESSYQSAILKEAINPKLCQEKGSQLKIVYTPIHGAGLKACTEALKNLGFNQTLIVKEQARPDGTFPTVKSPNPEDPEALKLAVGLMKKENADIVMGSDPDTDRLGVALRHHDEIVFLNGNQIGVLMLHYLLSQKKQQGQLREGDYFVKTIVTTPLQDKLANSFGVEIFNTLTGFKWICRKINEIEKEFPKKRFLFATEESFGYLNHPYARDKDGVSSVALMAEVALWHKLKGHTLVDALDTIYQEYGFSAEQLVNRVYKGKEGAEKINRIMNHFRQEKFPEIGGTKVEKIEDYESLIVTDLSNGSTKSLDTPKSNVLGYLLENGGRFYLRPSGTEPKIKFYIMLSVTEGSLEEKKTKAKKLIENFVNFIDQEINIL